MTGDGPARSCQSIRVYFTYLLTSLLSRHSTVACFSDDGSSFHVIDQSSFASTYLPQYFKHANYGSFVRQLNLYGYTSSRLPSNNDIVVWSHPHFHRDRREEVKLIKRAKKAKHNKTAHVVNNVVVARSPSPSLSDSETTSSSNPVKSVNFDWMENEFASLRKQNQELEKKLDILLSITLERSSMNLEQSGVGDKRRRIDASSYEDGAHCQQLKLASISEEPGQTLDRIEPDRYQYHTENGDSTDLKAFVDIMLHQDEEEKSECDESEEAINEREPSGATLDDELMREALSSTSDYEMFALNDEENDGTNQTGDVTRADAVADKASGPAPITISTLSSGVEENSTVVSGDIEEGNASLPVGVHVIEAEAELVREVGPENNGMGRSQVMITEERRHRRKVMILLSFLAVLVLVLVITIPATTAAKNSKRNNKQDEVATRKDVTIIKPEGRLRPCKVGERPSNKHGGCIIMQSSDGDNYQVTFRPEGLQSSSEDGSDGTEVGRENLEGYLGVEEEDTEASFESEPSTQDLIGVEEEDTKTSFESEPSTQDLDSISVSSLNTTSIARSSFSDNQFLEPNEDDFGSTSTLFGDRDLTETAAPITIVVGGDKYACMQNMEL